MYNKCILGGDRALAHSSQLGLSGAHDQSTAMLQTLLRLLDHVVDDNFRRLDVLLVS